MSILRLNSRSRAVLKRPVLSQDVVITIAFRYSLQSRVEGGGGGCILRTSNLGGNMDGRTYGRRLASLIPSITFIYEWVAHKLLIS